MAKNGAKTKDWRNLPVEKWNATTFREYMKFLHKERFGIPYVTNNHGAEGRMLKNTWEEYGKPATKRFIEVCFNEYRPTAKYPGLNYGFMYSYMRQRVMPRVLKEMYCQTATEKHQTATAGNMTEEDFNDWI